MPLAPVLQTQFGSDKAVGMRLLQRAVAADVALIRKGSWVRRRRNGTSPQFGTAKQKAAARNMRSAYRSWL